MVAGRKGSGGSLFFGSDGDLFNPVLSNLATSFFFGRFNICCWISYEEATLVGPHGRVCIWSQLSSISASWAAGVRDAAAFSFGMLCLVGQRFPSALTISWFQERGAILEITSLLINVVKSQLWSDKQLKSSNRESSVVLQGFLHTREGIFSLVPRCSARLKATMQGMCWTESDNSMYNAMLDVAMWVLLYASNQILDAASSRKVISSYCMHLRSQDFLDGDHGKDMCPLVFAAHCWEYENWNCLLCVNLWTQVDIIASYLLHKYIHTQQLSFNGSKTLGFWISWLQIDHSTNVSTNLELIFRSFMASPIATTERYFLSCFSCTCLSLSHDHCVEDAVSMLFGLCHRRWSTTPPLLILRFNSGDSWSLSSVKAIRYLQLNFIPCVHIPDRPSGEPPAGHQPDRTIIEALEDCRCGNFESGLSTDGRTPFGSICDLRHLLHQFRSSSSYVVQLGTYLSCSTLESHVLMYLEP